MFDYWPEFTLVFIADLILVCSFVPWIIMTRHEAPAAVAWCLVVILMPIFGAFLYWVFGYRRMVRPLRRLKRHRAQFQTGHPPRTLAATRRWRGLIDSDPTWQNLGSTAERWAAFPVSDKNQVTLFHRTLPAFDALMTEIRAAKNHIHMEFYIIQADETGKRLIDLLCEKAKAGVQVRLLYDAVGSFYIGRLLGPLEKAGGKTAAFLPLAPFKSRFRINLRTHRKIAILDGRVGFTGGMNVGNEYLGLDENFGYWRDEFMRIEGPAVASMQRIFAEDWDFSAEEPLNDDGYFPMVTCPGESLVQMIASGPDQEQNSMRQTFLAAMAAAKKRLWIASPYFVPDPSVLDAIMLAHSRGVDVRILGLLKADHMLVHLASRYYWQELLEVGVKIYQYKKGMMHSKLMLVDGRWGMVGSANLDNRSLRLNFEVGCVLHSAELVADMETAFEKDMTDSIELDLRTFRNRPYLTRLAESTARLFSPIL